MASVGAVALVGSADPAAAQGADVADSRDVAPLESKSYELSCSTGSYTGRARVTVTQTGDARDRWKSTVTQYQMTNNGRNKGNVNLKHTARNLMGAMTLNESSKSSDSMVQDGAWHPLDLSLDTAVPWAAVGQGGELGVEFIFDKSGSDPRCTAAKSGPMTRSVTNVVKDSNSYQWEKALAYCDALSAGITCAITQTKSASSTVTLDGTLSPTGSSLQWITGNLSASWTNSREISISCTSPSMPAGSRFYAYPTGVRTTFQTRVSFIGDDMKASDGKAFEVTGNIACKLDPPKA